MFSPERQQPTQEKISSVEKGLEQVDFPVLQSICAKILTKAGVEEGRSQKISIDVTKKIEQDGLMSFFDSNDASYLVDEDKIVFSKRLSLPKFQEFISILVHELLHMVSDISKGENSTPENHENRVGLDEQWYSGKFLGLIPFYEDTNSLLNEGITQLLSEAITHEYFRRKGEQIVDIRDEERNVYLSGKAVVELLTKSISYRAGIPEDIAFQAIVRAMLNYDYDDFLKLVEEDPILENLVKKIEEVHEGDLETTPFSRIFGIGESKVVLDTIKVEGLETVFDTILNGRARKQPKTENMDDFYFNPFYKSLH